MKCVAVPGVWWWFWHNGPSFHLNQVMDKSCPCQKNDKFPVKYCMQAVIWRVWLLIPCYHLTHTAMTSLYSINHLLDVWRWHSVYTIRDSTMIASCSSQIGKFWIGSKTDTTQNIVDNPHRNCILLKLSPNFVPKGPADKAIIWTNAGLIHWHISGTKGKWVNVWWWISSIQHLAMTVVENVATNYYREPAISFHVMISHFNSKNSMWRQFSQNHCRGSLIVFSLS